MEEVPFEDRHVPRVEIDWDRSAWWWYPLTRAIHPAVRMLSLALSLVALLVIFAGVMLGERLFDPRWNSDAFGWHFENFDAFRGGGLRWPIVEWLVSIAQAFVSFQAFGLAEFAFVIFSLLWVFTVSALFGGVLARRAAVELGQRTVATWSESLGIVWSRWQSFLWATGMHLVGIAFLLVPPLILGFVSRLGTVGAIIAGILLLLMFPLVFGIGRFALSAIVCFPLSVCAICVEKKADAFEGFSRSNAYFFQRPVVGVLCVLVLLAFGLVGEQIVYWTLNLGWWLTSRTFNLAGNNSANAFISMGSWLTASLIGAYWFSFFWSGSAAAYLILRRSVDNCELDEMETIESEMELSLPNIPTTSQPAATAEPPASSSQPAMETAEPTAEKLD